MSKPSFSKKRDGKKVPTYPLMPRKTGKSKTTKRAGAGRPRKPRKPKLREEDKECIESIIGNYWDEMHDGGMVSDDLYDAKTPAEYEKWMVEWAEGQIEDHEEFVAEDLELEDFSLSAGGKKELRRRMKKVAGEGWMEYKEELGTNPDPEGKLAAESPLLDIPPPTTRGGKSYMAVGVEPTIDKAEKLGKRWEGMGYLVQIDDEGEKGQIVWVTSRFPDTITHDGKKYRRVGMMGHPGETRDADQLTAFFGRQVIVKREAGFSQPYIPIE